MVGEAPRDTSFELLGDSGKLIPDRIADNLRGRIETGGLRPGEQLPNETELARQMRVARSSVRSALQKLESERLVEVRRGLGWFVCRNPRPVTSEIDLFAGKSYKAADLFEMRIALETLGVVLAAVRAGDGEVDEIAKCNTQHGEAAEDPEELLRTDEAFHLALMRAGHNELLIPTYEQVVGELAEWRLRSFAEQGSSLRSAREHARIVRFLKNRDVAGIRTAMTNHLGRLYLSLPDLDEEPLDL